MRKVITVSDARRWGFGKSEHKLDGESEEQALTEGRRLLSDFRDSS